MKKFVEIFEGNKLILELLGYKLRQDISEDMFIHPNKGSYRLYKTKFHCDWDCLMLVVEYIESLGNTVKIEGTKNFHYCYIYYSRYIICRSSNSKKEAVYSAIIKFIEVYKK